MSLNLLRKEFLYPILILVLISNNLFAATGNVIGKITDSTTGNPLPFANVLIEGTFLGSATDLDGNFSIRSVPVGEQNLVVTFVGYKKVTTEVFVVENITTQVEISLESDDLISEEIIISVQAQGQREAINQQISSNTSKNVVSAKKIQELPEANAAEAVGRLPGISLQREGGEGNKVVIRGLSPRYSKVQIEGVSMAATGDEDRSTDLSMISQYMLGGIEVTKAATPDQEADQLGGTVNFKLKGAPEKAAYSIIAQGGYNGIREEVKDYKFVLSGSMRFFDNSLGLIGTFDIERKNRSDNSAIAGYELQDDYTIANRVDYRDIDRVNNRLGGSIVLDFNLLDTKFKIFSMYNKVETDIVLLREVLDPGNLGPTAREHRFTAIDSSNNLDAMATSLSLEHLFGNLKLEAGASYSFAEREMPNSLRLDAVEESAFGNFRYEDPQELNGREGLITDGSKGYLHPTEFRTVVNKNLDRITLDWIFNSRSRNYEENFTTNLDFTFNVKLSQSIDLKFKFGGKYKHKSREYDYESFEHAMWWSTFDLVKEEWAEVFAGSPFLDNFTYGEDARFPYGPFIDQEFDGTDFLDGEYEIENIPNIELVRELVAAVDKDVPQNAFGMVRNYNVSIPNDYSGKENYYAGYLMPTFQLGNDFILIPGFRFEHNETEYGGNRTQPLGQWDDPIIYDSVVTKRVNNFFLPMIHARYNITDGFDIRASYTQTISRPSYNLIIPSWQEVVGGSLTWNNPNLVPIESTNLDLLFSFYGNKVGLFTLGAFHKSISNFIYNPTTYITDESQILDEYPDNVRVGGQVFGYINNPNDAKVFGLEVEWQSNFWFLPSFLKGIVFNINYTYTDSELVYPLINPVTETNIFGIERIVGSEDGSYKDRLIDQPDHLLNIMLGYDYEGFSIRWSMRLKSDVFMQDDQYEELRQSTEPLTLYDLSIKQNLPVEGLKVYGTLSNISKAIDTNTNRGTGWFASRSFYGMTGEFGIRFDF